jgi:ubiquinone/menaquinone biosynthesis C-methylase UbiE
MEFTADRRAVCVNLGCGNNIRKSDAWVKWINLDRSAREGVDIVQDLEDGLPCFENESIDSIAASHVFEHVKNWTKLMAECYRVLKPKGILNIRVPDARCRAAIADPTHCNFFVNETFQHFDCDSDLGFDTLGMRQMGFKLKWNESIVHFRNTLDDGVPGNYYTEIVIDYEKQGPEYPWEKFATKKDIDQVAI